jgi:N6-L-threonylcarbamoyladenine synthase
MKSIDACKESGIETLLIGGGVAANSRLREMAEDRAAKAGLELRIPPAPLCTDNGAMVAALGSELLRGGVKPSELGIAVDSSASISVISK